MKQKIAGFTLIELMLVVAIIGLLAAVAYPAYTDSVRKGRRADATTTLLQLQLAQERKRATTTAYASNLTDLGYTGTTSPKGIYTLAITTATATSYTMTATPTTGTDQASDSCGTFTITQDGPDISTAAKKACWSQ